MGKEEEKTQMGEMEGLRGRRGACPSGWLVLRRILDHSYQMDVRSFQATEGMERSRSNRKATASPRCPSSMQMAETQPLSHTTSPQGSEAPLHPAPGLRLSVSVPTPSGLEPRLLYSHLQSVRPAATQVVALTSPQPDSTPPGPALSCHGVKARIMQQGGVTSLRLSRRRTDHRDVKPVHKSPLTPLRP